MTKAEAGSDHPLILIDGSNWLFRAYYALPPLSAPDGTPTNAVYGMRNMLRRLIKDYQPQSLAVVFDPSGKTFREEIYAEYKANRDETPEDLRPQFPLVRELCEVMGLKVLVEPEVEADDVIGTLARQAEADGKHVLIVSGDKDLAQLVSDKIHLLDTMKNRRMDIAGVEEKFGVLPESIIDYLALMGDSSDNIPGVPGVGPKTAAKLIREHGSLQGVIDAADGIKGKMGEKIRASIEFLPMSQDLATIRTELKLEFDWDDLTPQTPDEEKFAAFQKRLGMGQSRSSGAAKGKAEPAPAPQAPVSTASSDQAQTKVEIVLDIPALKQLVAELQAAELICVDTETDSLNSAEANLVGLAFSTEPGRGWYFPIAHDYLGAPEQLDLKDAQDFLGPILADPNKPKVGQHIKYDLNVLARHGMPVQGVAFDTMLESYVLDAVGGRHDMDSLAQRFLDHQTIKFEEVAGKGKKQITFNQVSLDKAAPYSAEDADITLRLHAALHPQLQQTPALGKVFSDIEMPLVPVLAGIEQTGVKVDVPLLRKISNELAQRMDELQGESFKVAGTEFNLGSPKQLGEILFKKLELRVVAKTPKGEPSTAENVLEELAAEHELPRLILEWRGMQKLRSTYAEQLPNAVNERTGRIHTSYHQAVAATGRLSSQDPNLQNIPIRTAEGRRIRQAFVPESGCSLLAIDYSQIELRLMAHFSADKRLVEAFNEGLDVHQATAAEVFDAALDKVSGEQRRAAKAINFGLIYGMSAFGLAKQLGIGRGEAADYIERFFGRYPGVKQFMDGTKEAARSQGFVETLYGRRLNLPNIKAKNAAQRQYAERTAINAPLQGTAADLIKLAMIDLQQWIDRDSLDCRMIMQVHDELVFEAPEKKLKEWAPVLAERMCKIGRLKVPLVADFGLGANWDLTHSDTESVSS